MKNSTQKKIPVWLLVLLWIIAFPIMLVVTLVKGIIAFVKTTKIKKKAKIIIATVVLIIVGIDLAVALSNEKALSGKTSSNNSRPPQSISDSGSQIVQDTKDDVDILDVIANEVLRADFVSACEQIGIETKKIKDLKENGTWAGGTQYTFSYNDKDFDLFCNMDSTVETIRLGHHVALYQRGFEPYQLEDYVVSLSMGDRLQTLTKELVTSQLNYPSTAKFPAYNWSYGREVEIYTVESYVTAANAFNVQSDIPFAVMYRVEDGNAIPIFFKLEDNILIDHRDSISAPERKEVDVANDSNVSNDSGIVLTYGEHGEYGETITLDGEDNINYYVPAGTYIVKNRVNYCKVYLASDSYKRTPDGYMENDIIEALELTQNDEEKTITVRAGQHIELTLNASVLLISVE